MRRRYLTLTSLIVTAIPVALITIGCGGNRGGKVTLQKTLGPGGRLLGNRKGTLDKKFLSSACLNLTEVEKALRAETDGLAVHSRDYRLGQVSTAAKDHRVAFTAVTDSLSRELLTRRALTGENAPIFRAAERAADLLDAPPLANLLILENQDGCEAVAFKAGAKFKVQHGDRRSLNLINPATGEQREYILFDDNLVINIFAPVDLKTCDGGQSPAKFERISMRVTWGENIGQLKLVGDYARLLGVPETVSSLNFEQKLKSIPARVEALKCE